MKSPLIILAALFRSCFFKRGNLFLWKESEEISILKKQKPFPFFQTTDVLMELNTKGEIKVYNVRARYDYYKTGKKGGEMLLWREGKDDFPYELFFEKGTYGGDRDPRKVILDNGEMKEVVFIQATSSSL